MQGRFKRVKMLLRQLPEQAEDVAAEVVAAGPPVSDMHKDATLDAARIAEDDKDNVGAPAPPASDMDEDAALAAAKEVEDAHEVGAAASPGPDMDEDAALAAAKTAGDVADEVGAPASPASDMDEDAALAAAKEVEDAHEVGAAAPPGPDMDEDAALAAAKTAEDVAEEVGAPASPASEMDEEMMELLKEGWGGLKRLDAQRAAPAPTPEGMDTDAGPGPEPEAEDEPETLQPKKVIKKRITMRDIDKTFDDDFFNEEADEEEVGEGDEGGQKRKLSQKDGTPMDEGWLPDEEDEYVARMRRRGDKERVDSDAPAGSGDAAKIVIADSQASGAMDIDENDDVVEKQRKLRGKRIAFAKEQPKISSPQAPSFTPSPNLLPAFTPTEFAQKDRIGKGAAPEIKPLSDILAKLKSRKEAEDVAEPLKTWARDSVKAAKPVAKAPDAPLDVSALMQKATALDKAPAGPDVSSCADNGAEAAGSEKEEFCPQQTQGGSLELHMDMSATQVEATEEQHEPLPNEPQPIAEPGANEAAAGGQATPPKLATRIGSVDLDHPDVDPNVLLSAGPSKKEKRANIAAPVNQLASVRMVDESSPLAAKLRPVISKSSRFQLMKNAAAAAAKAKAKLAGDGEETEEKDNVAHVEIADAEAEEEISEEEDEEEESDAVLDEEYGDIEEEEDSQAAGREEEESEVGSEDLDDATDAEGLSYEEEERLPDGVQTEEEEERARKAAAAAAGKASKAAVRASRPKGLARFVDAEAELSDDGEGGDDDEDNDAMDRDLEGLISNEREGAGDERGRLGMHQTWQEEQDLKDVKALLHGIKTGFRANKKGALDDDDGTDADARRRRAKMFGDSVEEDEEAAAAAAMAKAGSGMDLEIIQEEEEGGEGGDKCIEEIDRQRHASRKRLKESQESQDLLRAGSLVMDTSQDVLALISRASSQSAAAAPAPAADAGGKAGPSKRAGPSSRAKAKDVVAPPARFTIFGRDLTNNGSSGAGSFLGRAASSSAAVRSTSNIGSGRTSFVFGIGDSNSAAPGVGGGEHSRDGFGGNSRDGTHGDAAGAVGQPNSFAGLKSLIKEGGGAGAGAAGGQKRASLFNLISSNKRR
eukprot:gene17926-24320_t